MTTIKNITDCIEALAPLQYAENFDNIGLLIGNDQTEVTNVLVTLDTLEETVNEAIERNCNLIVSFHPIIFSGLKKINGTNYVERVVLKAIQNNIAIYATHTALDTVNKGVSAKMCEVLGLQNTQVLIPKKGLIKKLTTYVPKESAKFVQQALFAAGAGNIGNYSECSFTSNGTGTFNGKAQANPTIGKKGERTEVAEIKLTVTFEGHLETAILNSLHKNHPYEEVAFEIITLENLHQQIGMGMLGKLPEALSEKEFLSFVKKRMKTDCIRHSELLNKKIQKVAVLGGAGSFAINKAKAAKADAYISADFKYHEFFKAEKQLLLVDVGHYESEQFTKNLLVEHLTKKITNFAPAFQTGNIILSEKSTNPIYYS